MKRANHNGPAKPSVNDAVKLAVVALIALVALHVLFKVQCPIPGLVATWSSGEALGYVGSVLGAVATIVAIMKTIAYTEETRKEDQRLSVLPCIALEALNPRNKKSHFNSRAAAGPQGIRECIQDASSDAGYTELQNKNMYVIVRDGEVTYQTGLDEHQRERVEFYDCEQSLCLGTVSQVANPTLYLPLVLSSIGSGPALNVSIALKAATTLSEVPASISPTGPVFQLPLGETRYLGLYFEDAVDPSAVGAWQLVVDYQDIQGNEYRQGFELTFTKDGDGRTNSCLSFAINRILVRRREEKQEVERSFDDGKEKQQ